MESRRALFKKNPAKLGKFVTFSHLKENDEASVVGRLESKLLKKNPTGSYFIGVCVFMDEEGNLMNFSSIGKNAERFDGEFKVRMNLF